MARRRRRQMGFGQRLLALLLLAACPLPAQPESLGPPAPAEDMQPSPPPPPAEPPAEEGPPATPPAATEPPPPTGSTKPRPTTTAERRQATFSGRYLRRDEREDTIFGEGDVRVQTEDLDATGERVLADLRAGTIHVDGPILGTRPDGTTFETASLDIDLNDDTYSTGSFFTRLAPTLVERGATEPINIYGSDAYSTRDSYFRGHNVVVSGCPARDLKYHIQARTIEVFPHKKLVLRSAKVFLFGVPLLAFGKLVLPLRRYRRTEWLPEIGRNDIYGWFARMRYFYDLADSQLGNVSSMVTEKRGTFLGVEHDFGIGRGDYRGDGSLDLEYGTRRAELSVRGDLNQRLGPATSLRMNGSFSQNSGFSSTTKQSNLTGTLDRRFDFGSTQLSFDRSQTDSGALQSSFMRMRLNQRFDVGQVFSTNLSADWSERDSSGQTSDQELETRLRAGGQWKLFDWEVTDERRFDLEGSRFAADDNRAVTEIVPQLTLRTDSRRLGLGFPDLISLRLDTSVGQFREFVTNPGTTETSRSTVLRTNFDLNGDVGRLPIGPGLRFRNRVRYSQSFFDHPDPAAKYIVATAPTLEWGPWKHSRVDLSYRWQEVSGFSPLRRFDFAQTINDFDIGADFFLPDPVHPRGGLFSLSLDGGYDLLLGRYRDLRIGTQAHPLDWFMMQLSTSYALDGRGVGDAGFRSLRGELQLDSGRRYRHEIGFTYDPRNGKLQNVDSLLQFEPLPHFTLQNALTYDGLREKVTFNDILATLDMGCVALVGTYRQQVHEFRLDLNITAFPGFASLFGTGRFGQQFSTSQGYQF